jgi:hypothetical protein
MGYSMRTPEFRITRWVDRETRETLDTEIYDHRGTDPEMVNLAARGENLELLERLNSELDKHYAKEHAIDFLEFKE